MKKLQYILPPALIVLAAFVLSWRTSDFKAFTVYSQTFAKATPIGNKLPDSLSILMDNGQTERLDKKVKGHYTLLSFVFLKCPMVCPVITGRLDHIYETIYLHHSDNDHKPIGNDTNGYRKLQLLTVSFDSRRDNLQDVCAFKKEFFNVDTGNTTNKDTAFANDNLSLKRDGHNWTFGVISNKNQPFIKRQLASIGFWLYQTTSGMYNHSPYLYLVGPNGLIKAVYDPGKFSDKEIIEKLKADIGGFYRKP